MDLYEVLDQVVALLRQRGRVTYRALKRQFALEDDFLEDLKAELFFAHPQVGEDSGQGLVWRGEEPSAAAPAGNRITILGGCKFWGSDCQNVKHFGKYGKKFTLSEWNCCAKENDERRYFGIGE